MGKTTLINELQNRGHVTVPEIARELIMEQQHSNGDALPWKDKKRYMETLFQRSVESYGKTVKDHGDGSPVFFDRGFLDALCHAALEGLAIDREMKTVSENLRYNGNVFILPPWKDIYQTDAQRKQDWNEAVFTHNKMIQTYRAHGYELVEVPRESVRERADFILDRIGYH